MLASPPLGIIEPRAGTGLAAACRVRLYFGLAGGLQTLMRSTCGARARAFPPCLLPSQGRATHLLSGYHGRLGHSGSSATRPRKESSVRARGRTRDAERGQILAMMVISLMALCALAGLAADMGFFSDYRRRMQTAADAAAMAGAQHVRRERLLGRAPNLTDVQNEGYKASASNAFTKDLDGTQVTVHWPPLSGPYANAGFVEAIITQPRPTIFMAILGFQSATVTTRAVEGTQDAPNCIYALRQTASSGGTATNALNFNGGAQVDASCGVVDNFNLSGGGSGGGGNAQLTATSIAVTGSMSGCCFTPTPTTGVPPEPDPLAGRAGLPPPTTFDYGTGTAGLCGSGALSSGASTRRPGVYCVYIGIVI